MVRQAVIVAVLAAAGGSVQAARGTLASARVRDLASTLEFGDTVAKVNAIQVIGTFGPAVGQAAGLLIEALKDKAPSVRRAAASSLGWIALDNPKAVAALTEALKDGDAGVAAAAAAALKTIKPRGSAVGATTRGAVRPLRAVVGFVQIGIASDWRAAQTRSIQIEAKRRSCKLLYRDGGQKLEQQFAAVRELIATPVEFIVLSPVLMRGWQKVLTEAKRAGIPVIVVGREVDVWDTSVYVTTMVHDFAAEGLRAGQWLVKKTGGKARVVVLAGTSGSSVALARQKGFVQAIAKHPGMKILAMHDAEFQRAKAQAVMADMLMAHGKHIDAVYAHNDNMAFGAIAAIKQAGLGPGKNITIVSIDGMRDALKAIVAGELGCTIECSPLVGPQLFDIIQDIRDGKKLPKSIAVKEGLYDRTTAAKAIKTRQY